MGRRPGREQRTDERKYRFGYQGQFAEKDDETGWNHFELREYDAVVGRWMATDPARQYWSPYIGVGNDPVSGVDPDGAFRYRWQAMIYSMFIKGKVDIEKAIGGDREGEWYVGRHVRLDEGLGVAYQRTFESGFDIQLYVNVDIKLRGGFLSYNDYGTVGAKADVLSVNLAELSAKGTWGLLSSMEEGGISYDHFGKNGLVKINQGGSIEIPLSKGGPIVDVKGSVQYIYDINTGHYYVHKGYVGGGAPYLEGRADFEKQETSVRIGLQEDWGKSTPGHASIGWKASGFAGIRIVWNN